MNGLYVLDIYDALYGYSFMTYYDDDDLVSRSIPDMLD